MNRIAPTTLTVLVLALAMAGCMTPPTAQQPTKYASYVGDQSILPLDEIMVAVNLKNGDAAFCCSLHIGLAVTVTPKTQMFDSTTDMRDILWRSKPRIEAAIVQAVLERGNVSAETLSLLRGHVEKTAQQAVSDIVAAWKHADQFTTRICITSFFLTDLSSGRTAQQRGWW